eukprot:CAMPEP_0172454910 /NCGR_PEP_ID=MMETSP1065-20121228/11760_1 /TAXON_ID=265537 /ORGANISM="Amphiprora paludosa, Strain CCMP125" /LENGTH=70 /DNA_ID=CAMNT_0013207321 /DNA_START=85 /DNA_END=294 /DNA_ORIENTATION=+
MKQLLIRKLLHWNGRLEQNDGDLLFLTSPQTSRDEDQEEMPEDLDHLPEPPKSMTEIFECVGTLHILMED